MEDCVLCARRPTVSWIHRPGWVLASRLAAHPSMLRGRVLAHANLGCRRAATAVRFLSAALSP